MELIFANATFGLCCAERLLNLINQGTNFKTSDTLLYFLVPIAPCISEPHAVLIYPLN